MPYCFYKMGNKKDVHIGSIIRDKLKDHKDMSISKFAKAICCNRSNVYSIFERKSIDTEQLLLISKVLDYDFIAEYYEKEDNPKRKVLAVIEIQEGKLQDLEDDSSIKIVHRFEASE